MTDNQQIAFILSAWLVISIIIEILLAKDAPWSERTKGDPPPVLGGIAIGAIVTAALAVAIGLLWGAGYGLYWLWTH